MEWLIDGFNSLAQAISNYIAVGIEIIIYAIFYPIIMIAYWLSAITHLVIDPNITYAENQMIFANSIFNFLFTVIGSILPFKLGILFFAGLTLVILFRIYHFIKRIYILGTGI